jgi:hypothetical protein
MVAAFNFGGAGGVGVAAEADAGAGEVVVGSEVCGVPAEAPKIRTSKKKKAAVFSEDVAQELVATGVSVANELGARS